MNELDIESTHVLLIGAGNYPNWPKMNIPNVSANLEELASLLSDPFYCGIPKEKISIIEDEDVENTNSALQEFFDNIQTSKATVILYYSGHGLQSTKAMDDLFLATRNIRETRFEASSLRISDLRKLFSDCVASKKILLLDCCYAGKITKGFMSDDSSENVAKLNEFDGTYIMAASSEYERARFDPDDPNSPTKFTGKLIDVIKNGIESDEEYCTLNSIYSEIRSSFLIQKDAPKPVQIGQNNIGSFPIFKNKKFIDRIPPDEQAWNKATVLNNVIAYNAFIDDFPQSKYKQEAEKLIQIIEDEEAWARARDKDTIGGYRYYLSNYLKYAIDARQKLNLMVRIQEEEELWKSVKNLKNVETVQLYIDRYPGGKYINEALLLNKQLNNKDGPKGTIVYPPIPEEPTPPEIMEPVKGASGGNVKQTRKENLEKIYVIAGFFIVITSILLISIYHARTASHIDQLIDAAALSEANKIVDSVRMTDTTTLKGLDVKDNDTLRSISDLAAAYESKGNAAQAYKWFRKGLAICDPSSSLYSNFLYNYGYLYYKGWGVDPDPRIAYYLLVLCVKQGGVGAVCDLWGIGYINTSEWRRECLLR